MSVGECIICTCFRRAIHSIEMLLVRLWDNVINMCTCFCGGVLRLIEMLLVCLLENITFAHASGGLYTYLKCCLWENVACARVFRGLCTLN